MSPTVITWVDGERTDSLPLPDRGLAFGDGLFETLLLLDGRPALLPYHLERLSRGLLVLQLGDASVAVDRALILAGESAPGGPAALRITVTRGGGPRGYLPPVNPQLRLIAQLGPLSRDSQGWRPPARLGIASIGWSRQPHLAGIKHLNRLEQVLAAAEYTRRGWDEAIMLDQEGAAVSVVAGNLFAVQEGTLLTPPLETCGIAGTRRRLVMERLAPDLGLRARECSLSTASLIRSQELFYCNSLIGLRAVAQLGDQSWQDFPVTRALFVAYRTLLSGADKT